MEPYLRETDLEDINEASTFEDLRDVAFRILENRMPTPAGMVCGPITTGGRGSIEKNIEAFNSAISDLRAQGEEVFSQMPFEESMWRIKETDYYEGADHLLRAFYLPLFRSNYISTLYFIPGWQESTGASWEHEQGKRFGLDIVYLERGSLDEEVDFVLPS